jgi:hypothetical protein
MWFLVPIRLFNATSSKEHWLHFCDRLKPPSPFGPTWCGPWHLKLG